MGINTPNPPGEVDISRIPSGYCKDLLNFQFKSVIFPLQSTITSSFGTKFSLWGGISQIWWRRIYLGSKKRPQVTDFEAVRGPYLWTCFSIGERS